MSIEIRPLGPAQARVFSEFIHAVSSDGLGFGEEALQYYRDVWTTECIARASQDGRWVVLAAWEAEMMVGLLLGMPPEGGVGTIVWVLVRKDRRRQGIGRRIFEEACRRYRDMGAHKVKLTVPEKKSATFYEKQGMQIEGHHRNHWWHMDMWSMGKSL